MIKEYLKKGSAKSETVHRDGRIANSLFLGAGDMGCSKPHDTFVAPCAGTFAPQLGSFCLLLIDRRVAKRKLSVWQ
jgi:hypothetical protein